MDRYTLYKGKIEEIREVNPKCNIFVCPVLPTRCKQINDRIRIFNNLLLSDLIQCNMNIKFVNGLGEFVDMSTLTLKSVYHQTHKADGTVDSTGLHINRGAGIRLLVNCIKFAIFSCKRGGSKLVSGKSFSNAVKGGPDQPVSSRR